MKGLRCKSETYKRLEKFMCCIDAFSKADTIWTASDSVMF